MPYASAFILALLAVAIFTPLIRAFALRLRVVDIPDAPRKIHPKPVPLLGGCAVFLGFVAVFWYLALAAPQFLDASIALKHVVGISLGGLALIVGGYLDDKYNLSPARQVIFPVAAAVIVVVSGIGIRAITNPLGGTFSLVWWEKVLFWWQGVGYRLTLPADMFTLVWLIVLMYATKLLDGLDGLVSGITVIGAGMIFLLATATRFFQPEVGLLAAAVAGAFAGFMPWNWHPAKIFLGTGGSTLAGFLLGTLAIVSGGKIATALLVMGIPILDLIWVASRRAFVERRSPFRADRGHLHFRLLDAGLTQQGAVVVLWIIAALFGSTTLFLQSKAKLAALSVLLVVMIVLAAYAIFRSRRKIHTSV